MLAKRSTRFLLLPPGPQGQRLQSVEHVHRLLALVQFGLRTEERRDVVHGVGVADDPVEGAAVQTKSVQIPSPQHT